MRFRRLLRMAGLGGLYGLTGCFSSVHTVTRVQVVNAVKSASVEQLQTTISERDAKIRTLNASVLITASTGGGREGKVKTYTSFRGYIFVRKPRDLRVILQLPVIGSQALDMVSNGDTFTLLIPPRKRAIVGTTGVTKPSSNGLENLRPAGFCDSLLVPGGGSDEYVELLESNRVLTPVHGHKDAVEEPSYDLEISRVSDGHVLHRERVVHISRVTLLPYQQDVYDNQGQVVTQATYMDYAPAGAEEFPREILITRPQDEYTLRIDVTKLTLNAPFENDQFELKIPPGIKVEHMD